MDQQPSTLIITQPTQANSITWSGNNKLAITTPNYIQILTPTVCRKDDKISIQFHRTVLNLEEQKASERFDTAGDRTAPFMTAYAVYNGFRCAAWSPVGIVNQGSSCLLTAITVSHRVLLYQQIADANNDNWIIIKELTNLIGKRASLSSHTLCAAWSERLLYQSATHAVLAMGTKAGHIALWRNEMDNDNIHHVTISHDSSIWVTNLEWSDWRKDGVGHAAYLFAGASDGTVTCVKISLKKDKINATAVHTWFEDDGRALSLIKISGSSEIGSQLKVAVAKSGSVHVGVLSGQADGRLMLQDDKWMSRRLPVSSNISGAVWSKDACVLHIFASEYANFSLVLEDKQLKIHDEYTKKMHADVNVALRTQAVEIAKSDNAESESNESYRATIWGIDSSPNNVYYALLYTLVPVYEKEIREAGPDSWVAYFLDVSNNVPITPLLLSSIVNRLSHRSEQGNADIYDIVDYFASHDAEMGLDSLLTDVKAFMDAQTETLVTSESVGNMGHLIQENTRINSAKLLFYINEHIKAYVIPNEVSVKANALAAEAKDTLSKFYIEVLLQVSMARLDSEWLAFDPQEKMQVVMIADSVMTLYPENDKLLKLAIAFYERMCHLKLGVGSAEIELASDLLDKKRSSIEPNEIQPREPCPSCQDYILFFKP